MFSLVFEAKKIKNEGDEKSYSFKRIFFCSQHAPFCALREKQILKSLRENVDSPFLPKFYHSFLVHGNPVIVTELLSGRSLEDVRLNFGLLSEETARFYIAEILCALVKLHPLYIVHLDVKPENVILRNSGHIVLSDFDRAFDMRVNTDKGVIRGKNFAGTARFMAPEVAKKIAITAQADVWSLGILTAELITGSVRPISNCKRRRIEMAQRGECSIENYDELSPSLRIFLEACLTYDHVLRPCANDVRNLEFFKDLNWEDVEMLRLVPPYLPTILEFKPKINVDPSDPNVLALALAAEIPEDQVVIHRGLAPLSQTALDSFGYTRDKLNEMFRDFEYEPSSSTSLDLQIQEGPSVQSENENQS
ncbi:hypothetical protein ACTXT7_010181 [Hymenolepis weldensis]